MGLKNKPRVKWSARYQQWYVANEHMPIQPTVYYSRSITELCKHYYDTVYGKDNHAYV